MRALTRALTRWSACLAAVLAASCNTDTTEVSVRSLENTSRTAWLCLGAPGDDDVVQPLSACRPGSAEDTGDFSSGPHLYSLALQSTRGELAVVDVSAANVSRGQASADAVLDQDAGVPGANFLPTGRLPVDIASLEDGRVIVASADVARPALYGVLPEQLRPCQDCEVPTLSSFRGCMLSSAPGRVVAVQACGEGDDQLVVVLPEEGRVALVDPAAVFSGAQGSLPGCIELASLSLTFPAFVPPPAGAEASQAECAGKPVGALSPISGQSRPNALASVDGDLFVGDSVLPVIHRIGVRECTLVAKAPLFPRTAAEPGRATRVSSVAAVRARGELWVYGVDERDGSVMVFQPDGATLTPVEQKHPEWNPLQPVDRIPRLSHVREISFFESSQAQTNPITGVAERGVRCDPNPALVTCNPERASCDPETLYRTDVETYASGAGPGTLRGTFGAAMLSTGQVVVIDVDDLDAACRGPVAPTAAAGCTEGVSSGGLTSQEISCNVVVPHTTRSGNFLTSAREDQRGEPGLSGFPRLVDADGRIVPIDGSPVRLTAPSGEAGRYLPVNGEPIPLSPDGLLMVDGEPQYAVALNHEDPRAHYAGEGWALTLEGALPGLFDRRGEFVTEQDAPALSDTAGRFCESGVESWQSQYRSALAAGKSDKEAWGQADAHGDVVEVRTALPEEADLYWVNASCDYKSCKQAFGSTERPTAARDIPIVEAYESHLVLKPSEGDDLRSCCLPTPPVYSVRAHNQWVLVGEASGMLHAVKADPETGVCRPACDETLGRMRSRVSVSAPEDTRADGSPNVLVHAALRLAVVAVDPERPLSRGARFEFRTTDGFSSFSYDLLRARRLTELFPASLTPLPSTTYVAIGDASLEGLFVLDLSTGSNTQFF